MRHARRDEGADKALLLRIEAERDDARDFGAVGRFAFALADRPKASSERTVCVPVFLCGG
jgi:hypothetical protein